MHIHHLTQRSIVICVNDSCRLHVAELITCPSSYLNLSSLIRTRRVESVLSVFSLRIDKLMQIHLFVARSACVITDHNMETKAHVLLYLLLCDGNELDL